MEKQHSLPEIKLGITSEDGLSAEKFFDVDMEPFKRKIMEMFYNKATPDEVISEDGFNFKPKMSTITLEIFNEVYNSCTDKQFIFALWQYIDSILRMECLQGAGC